MKLTLDHTQRLNLHTLLGAQRADLRAIRAIWTLTAPAPITGGSNPCSMRFAHRP